MHAHSTVNKCTNTQYLWDIKLNQLRRPQGPFNSKDHNLFSAFVWESGGGVTDTCRHLVAVNRHCTYSHRHIYIYAFSRRFYPKQLTIHSGYTFFLTVCVFPWNWTHNLCAVNAMLYRWATGTLSHVSNAVKTDRKTTLGEKSDNCCLWTSRVMGVLLQPDIVL